MPNLAKMTDRVLLPTSGSNRSGPAAESRQKTTNRGVFFPNFWFNLRPRGVRVSFHSSLFAIGPGNAEESLLHDPVLPVST